MRLALIADIHGNLVALDAVLSDLDAAGCDAVVALGDVIGGGPDSDLCLRRLRSRSVPLLRGNHERYVLAAADDDPAMRAANWAPIRFAAAQLRPAELAELRALPLALSLRALLGARADALPTLLLCHAAPADDYTHLHPATPAAQVRASFGGHGTATVVRGHNHLAFERRLLGAEGDELHVIALGSVGIPLDGSRAAQYALLEPDGRGGWRAEHRRVRYDVEAAAAAFRTRGFLAAGGVVARLLLREVLIGTHQLVPYMRYRATLPENVSWEDAFADFVRIGVE